MVRLFHATDAWALPKILSTGLCPPRVHGVITGTIYFESTMEGRKGPDPMTSLYFVRDPLDAENLAFTFSRGGIPTLLVINDRDFIGKNGARRVQRGNETILTNISCIPPSYIKVWQYIDGKWRRQK